MWYNNPMTDLVPLTQDLRLARVFEKLLSGEATTVKGACELADVARSTFYSLVGQGELEPVLLQLRQGMIAELIGQVASGWPTLIEKLLKDIENADTVRDRMDGRRTLLHFIKHLGGELREPEPADEAADWLREHGASFSPVQINISGDLICTGEKEQSPPTEEVVEGSAEELEG